MQSFMRSDSACRRRRFLLRLRFSTATVANGCPPTFCKPNATSSERTPMSASTGRAGNSYTPTGLAAAGAWHREVTTLETEETMDYGLNIRQDAALDFVSIGGMVHRLDPGIIPFRKATECKIHVSGGEFNVAANLSDCFGMRTGIATAMVDYPIGDLVNERVRAMGVKPFYKHFKHNGVSGPNIATVYSDRGQGVRAPVVFYNRCNEAAAPHQCNAAHIEMPTFAFSRLAQEHVSLCVGNDL